MEIVEMMEVNRGLVKTGTERRFGANLFVVFFIETYTI